MPRMIVVAGPPGSGKSSAFPVSNFGVAYFNADDRTAELNDGSYFGNSQAHSRDRQPRVRSIRTEFHRPKRELCNRDDIAQRGHV